MIASFVFQASVKEAQEALAKQKNIIMAQDKEIKAKSAEAVKHREQNNESQLKVKELEHNITKHKRETADAAAKVFQNCSSSPPVTRGGFSVTMGNGNILLYLLSIVILVQPQLRETS